MFTQSPADIITEHMDALQNARHELFAQNVAIGKSFREAYSLAGYKDDSGNSSNLAKRPEIIARIQDIQGLSAEAALVTKERVIAEIAKLAFAPVEPPVKQTVKVAALENLAKQLGLTSDRLQVNVDISLADLVNGSYQLDKPKVIEGEVMDITNAQEKPNDNNDKDNV